MRVAERQLRYIGCVSLWSVLKEFSQSENREADWYQGCFPGVGIIVVRAFCSFPSFWRKGGFKTHSRELTSLIRYVIRFCEPCNVARKRGLRRVPAYVWNRHFLPDCLWKQLQTIHLTVAWNLPVPPDWRVLNGKIFRRPGRDEFLSVAFLMESLSSFSGTGNSGGVVSLLV